MTNDEARWVTLLANIQPDVLETAPGSTWQLARECIEAIATGRDAALQAIGQRLAQGAARRRWPGHEDRVAKLREIGQRTTAAVRAGKNPFLDGRPYEPEEKR
jgi:hypothetical protein